MIRLHITAEGQTEQRFVKEVLCPHLGHHNVVADARCVLTSKDNRKAKEYRGGLVTYEKAKKDIQNWLKEDKSADCRFTTMFDLYALPENFPGYAEAMKQADKYERVALLEQALKDDIGDTRFIPYIQLHEFEALLLAAPEQLDWEYLEEEQAIAQLVAEVAGQNPELINGGVHTAPSKRIIKAIPAYENDKSSVGASVAAHIGLPTLREKCSHFNHWLTQLENLAGNIS